MNFLDACNAIRAKVKATATLPTYWPNDAREPKAEGAGFVYTECRLIDERPISLGPTGSRTHRDTGEATIYVYVPQGKGTKKAETEAQILRDAFAVDAVAGVTVTNKTIGLGSPVEGPGGRWFAIPVVISWFSDRVE